MPNSISPAVQRGCFLLLAFGAIACLATASADEGAISIEGEALVARARATQGRVVAQDMRAFGRGWSGNAHLSWVPSTQGHQLQLTWVVPRGGEYELFITYTKATNHADFVVFVGGKRAGGTLAGYAPRAATSGRVSLGRVRLARGANQIVITGTGKNRRSIGYVVGIDRFDAVVVGRTPPTTQSGPTVAKGPTRRPPKPVPVLRTRGGRVERPPPKTLEGLLRPWSRDVPGWRGSARSVSPVLEVQVRPASGTEFPAQYGPEVLVDLERHDSLERVFRLENRVQAANAVWQVLRTEPPPMARGWRAVPGVLADGNVAPLPARGTKSEFTIDFGAFYTPPARQDRRGLPRPGSRLAKGTRGTGVVKRGPRTVRAASPGAARTGSVQPGAIRVAPTTALEPWFGSLERVFWVRVACLDARGRLLGFPSNAVRVRIGKAPPLDIDLSNLGEPTADPAWVKANRPRLRILEYQPIRWEAKDADRRWVVSGPWPHAGKGGNTESSSNPYPFGPRGTKLYLERNQANESAWEVVTGAIGDVVSAFVVAVNWVSNAYETLKSEAVGALATMVPGCNATCRDLLDAGLEVGLAAVGLPPDIPDFDQLVKMGKGHLTDVLVEEALAQGMPGLSEPLLREAAGQLLDEIERRTRERAEHGPSGASWLRPDPDYQYRPAFLRIEISNPGKQVLRPQLTLMVAGGEPAWGWVFRQVNVNLPPLEPGERKEMVYFLSHDSWWWEAKDAQEHGGSSSAGRARDAWWAAYQGPCEIVASTKAQLRNESTGELRLGFSSAGLDQPADRAYRAR